MNILNRSKLFNAIPPAAIKDNAAYTSNVIGKSDDVPHDAKGVLFVVALGATDVAMAALIVKQSGTKSSGTALGGTPSTVVDAAAKPAADDGGGIALIYVPMSQWTEEYLQLQATAGNGTAGTYLSAVAIFDEPGITELSDVTTLGAISLDIA